METNFTIFYSTPQSKDNKTPNSVLDGMYEYNPNWKIQLFNDLPPAHEIVKQQLAFDVYESRSISEE